MQATIICFTENGCIKAQKIKEELERAEIQCQVAAPSRYVDPYGFQLTIQQLKRQMAELWGNTAFLFIGAMGIAVRMIAPYIVDKFSDSPVIVMDEKGEYMIPVLSSHIGGAQKIARDLAEICKAKVITTTATDLQNKFAVDLFAVENDLKIEDRVLAKKISAFILDGGKIGILGSTDRKVVEDEQVVLCDTKEEMEQFEYGVWITEKVMETKANVLFLRPQILTVGIGCKKGMNGEQIRAYLLEVLKNHNLSYKSVKTIASIALKKDEKGICQLAKEWGIPFVTYQAEELNQVIGVCNPSDFVKKVTGVDNVCERAALLSSKNSELLQEKLAKDGITIAIARIKEK